MTCLAPRHLAPALGLVLTAACLGSPIPTDTPAYTSRGRVMVPMRAIFEWLGARVDYDSATGAITARRGDTTVRIRVGDNHALVNGVHTSLDAPAESRGVRTCVPLRFVAEALGARVDWDERTGTVTIHQGSRSGTIKVAPGPTGGKAITSGTRSVSAAGRSFSVRLVTAELGRVRVKVGLAGGRVGRTESLAGIASRYGAAAGINGCFFDAYTSNPIKNPHHNLITNGRFVHKGNVGSSLGFALDNQFRMERLLVKIEGALDGNWGWPDNWYAYWINRLPESPTTITIFTPAWGAATGLNDGTQAVVSGGVIRTVASASQAIPQDGYVVYFRGNVSDVRGRFRVGRRCDYRLVRQDGSPLGFWDSVQEGIGCGPRLVANGQVALDMAGEGFSSAKVLSMSAGRSMVGVTRDRKLLMATCSGTVQQMAQVMKALGAVDAMNLDGGASSGLWVAGRYLTAPGRNISNALLVLE